MKSWNFRDVLVSVFLVVVLLITPAIMVNVGRSLREESVRQDKEFPRMEIFLNGTSFDEINSNEKDNKYTGNDLLVYNDNSIETYTDVEISGRGNLTWLQKKKPYALQFNTKVNLLGLSKSKRFVLMANFLDDSSLRNDMAMKFSQMVGEKYNYNGEYVELFIDNEYQGLYYLINKVEIDKNSVDLKNPYGILMELDNLHGSMETCYASYAGNCLVAVDVVNKDNLNRSARNFLDDYNRLEMAAEEGDFEIVNELANVESFAKYYLVSEFTSNPDAYNTSWFLYKDGINDQIYSGISWDFDLAFANKVWAGSDFFAADKTRVREESVFNVGYYDENGEYIDEPSDKNTARLMYYLMRMPEFEKVVKNVFIQNLSGRMDELIDWVKERAEQIDMAVREDALRWEKDDFEENTEKLISWIKRRYEYFEKIYGEDIE